MRLPIVHPDIERYLDELLPERTEVLREMEAQAEREGFPIVGPLVGRLLALLARATGARTVFELGSGFGYSAVWLAEAVGPGGRVICTDFSQERAAQAQTYLARAGLSDRVSFAVGDALALFAAQQGPVDMVFCDIDKEQYPEVVEPALARLRQGGLLVFDNTLWSGRVVQPAADEATAGVQKLNRMLHERDDLLTIIVPLRDGVSVSLKL